MPVRQRPEIQEVLWRYQTMIPIKHAIATATTEKITVQFHKLGEGCPDLLLGGERLCTVFNVTKNGDECGANVTLMAMGFNHLPKLIKTGERLRALLEADLNALEPWHKEAKAFLKALTDAQDIQPVLAK